jgi:hypothetical protein
VVKVLQHKSWQQAGAVFGYKGKDDVISDLKQAYKALLHYLGIDVLTNVLFL